MAFVPLMLSDIYRVPERTLCTQVALAIICDFELLNNKLLVHTSSLITRRHHYCDGNNKISMLLRVKHQSVEFSLCICVL